MKRRDFLLAGLLGAVPAIPAWAQSAAGTWPERPVRWILSQPAGSGPDIVARLVNARTGMQANFVVNRLLEDRDVVARMLAVGPIATPSGSAEDFGGYLRSEHQRLGSIVQEIGLLPE